MQRNEEGVSEEEDEFGVLHSGRRYKRLKTGAEKGESHSEFERREPCTIVQIIEIPHIEGEEEDSQFSPIIEESLSPTQTGSCVDSTTPCASPRSEVTFEDLSKALIVSRGRHSSSSQSSGSSASSQSQPTSPRGGTTQNNMVGLDNTLRLPEFQGVGSEDPEQHLFVCETIWAAKNVQDEAVNIAQLETTFRGHTLVWYMKLQSTTPTGQARTLAEIRQALLKEFKKPKSESQYITELKEIKQVQNESVWDYDQRFKDLMGRLTFQIPDQQHQEWFIAGLLPHIHRSLIQQKVVSQPEALEIAMKLEASPVGDGGGMVQVQTQLVSLTIQLGRAYKREGEAGTSLVYQV
jgi:hypothetical protein